MKKGQGHLSDKAELRRRAEKHLAKKKPESVSTSGAEDAQKLVHELQVHQIELELQNEELRQARQELEASLERYTDLYDFAPVGYLTVDRQGIIGEVNLMGASLLGTVRSEALGRSFEGFLSNQSRATFSEFLERAREGRAKQTCEAVLAVPGGEARQIQLEGTCANPEAAKTDQDPGWLCRLAMVDITPRKRAEREKDQLESQLRQAQKMEAIGTLASGIAHDFNNILGAIVGYAELARDDIQAGKSNTRDIEELIKAAWRAKNLVRQILTFSRKSTVLFEPMSLNRALQGMVQMLARTLPKDIAIELRPGPELPMIKGDAGQLEQVLMNLGTNARDAMPDGGRLVIETGKVFLDEEFCQQYLEVLPGPYVRLEVSDTGQGMGSLTLEHMYDPFFTTKEVGKGTGLGLSTIHGIVKSHGGHIFCASQPGKGTSFTIYLPAIQKDVPEPDRTDEAHQGMPRTDLAVLLVDDEEALRELGARTLERAGYQVLTAPSGEEALELYRQRRSSLGMVIMDLGMPGMGGNKCLESILKINPEAKVLITSGYVASAQVADALAAGAAGYVAKPFRKADLLKNVRNMLEQLNAPQFKLQSP